MRKLASEIIRDLEIRIANLEKEARSSIEVRIKKEVKKGKLRTTETKKMSASDFKKTVKDLPLHTIDQYVISFEDVKNECVYEGDATHVIGLLVRN